MKRLFLWSAGSSLNPGSFIFLGVKLSTQVWESCYHLPLCLTPHCNEELEFQYECTTECFTQSKPMSPQHLSQSLSDFQKGWLPQGGYSQVPLQSMQGLHARAIKTLLPQLQFQRKDRCLGASEPPCKDWGRYQQWSQTPAQTLINRELSIFNLHQKIPIKNNFLPTVCFDRLDSFTGESYCLSELN